MRQKQPNACSAQQLFLETAWSTVSRRCSALQMRIWIWTFLSTGILCGSTLEMLYSWDSSICVLLDPAFLKGTGYCLALFILFMTFCLSHFLKFLKLGKKLDRIFSNQAQVEPWLVSWITQIFCGCMNPQLFQEMKQSVTPPPIPSAKHSSRGTSALAHPSYFRYWHFRSTQHRAGQLSWQHSPGQNVPVAQAQALPSWRLQEWGRLEQTQVGSGSSTLSPPSHGAEGWSTAWAGARMTHPASEMPSACSLPLPGMQPAELHQDHPTAPHLSPAIPRVASQTAMWGCCSRDTSSLSPVGMTAWLSLCCGYFPNSASDAAFQKWPVPNCSQNKCWARLNLFLDMISFMWSTGTRTLKMLKKETGADETISRHQKMGHICYMLSFPHWQQMPQQASNSQILEMSGTSFGGYIPVERVPAHGRA